MVVVLVFLCVKIIIHLKVLFCDITLCRKSSCFAVTIPINCSCFYFTMCAGLDRGWGGLGFRNPSLQRLCTYLPPVLTSSSTAMLPPQAPPMWNPSLLKSFIRPWCVTPKFHILRLSSSSLRSAPLRLAQQIGSHINER